MQVRTIESLPVPTLPIHAELTNAQEPLLTNWLGLSTNVTRVDPLQLPKSGAAILRQPLLRSWLQQRGISPYNWPSMPASYFMPQQIWRNTYQRCYEHRWSIGISLLALLGRTVANSRPAWQHHPQRPFWLAACQYTEYTSPLLMGACFGQLTRGTPSAAWRNHLLGLHIEYLVELGWQERNTLLVWLGKQTCDKLWLDKSLQMACLQAIPAWALPMACIVHWQEQLVMWKVWAIGAGMLLTTVLDTFTLKTGKT